MRRYTPDPAPTNAIIEITADLGEVDAIPDADVRPAAVSTVPGVVRISAAPVVAQSPGGAPTKAVLISMLPRELSYQDRFALAKDVGFAAVEMQTVDDPAEAERVAQRRRPRSATRKQTPEGLCKFKSTVIVIFKQTSG